jgi:hypothetical protein
VAKITVFLLYKSGAEKTTVLSAGYSHKKPGFHGVKVKKAERCGYAYQETFN